MRRFVTFLNTQLKISLRDMNMPIFALLMPLVIFLVLGILYGGKPAYDGAGYTFLEQSFGAVSAVAICAGGLDGAAAWRSRTRGNGRFSKRLPGHAGHAGIPLGGPAGHVCGLLRPVPGHPVPCVAALVKVRLHGALLPFLGSWLLTMLSTLALGMLVGGVAKDTKQAGVLASILYFPMLIFSGATLPMEVMPPVDAEDRQLLPPHPGHHPDEERLSRRPHRQRHPAPVCVILGLTALCVGLADLLFPLGIKHAIKKPPTPETSSQRWGFSFQIVTARPPAKSAGYPASSPPAPPHTPGEIPARRGAAWWWQALRAAT